MFFRALSIDQTAAPDDRAIGRSVTALDTKQPLSVIESEKEIEISLGAEVLLKSYGVPADRISTRGYGQSQPTAANDTAEGRRKDRRVEIRYRRSR